MFVFRNEDEFKAHVQRALQSDGHTTRREVPVRTGHRLDFLAIKDGVKKGIEAKFDHRGLLDDLTKSQRLLRLPDLDEMYVCGPKMLMSDDVQAIAAQLGVGLLALRDDGELEWLAGPRKLGPARLSLGGNYAGTIEPGGEAKYNATVFNGGDKAAVDVEVRMVMAGPFVARYPSKARAKLALLDGHDQWSPPLVCNVKRSTKPGNYPLVISLKAANVPREDSTVHYQVKPPP